MDFNPRTYVRCDFIRIVRFKIHIYFNPRTYVRCDSISSKANFSTQKFQSTHLREVRLSHVPLITPKGLGFQSTHLREVRLRDLAAAGWTVVISIHAPT